MSQDQPPYGPPPPPPYGGPPPGHPYPSPYPSPYAYPPQPWAPQPGVIPLRPLGAGDVIKGSFRALGRTWKPLVGLHGLVALVTILLTAGVLVTVAVSSWETVDDYGYGYGYGYGADPTPPLLPSLLMLPVLLVYLLMTGLVHASGTAALRAAVVGDRVTWSLVWRQGWSGAGRVLRTILLMACVAVPVILVAYLPVLLTLTLAGDPAPSDGASALLLVLGCLLLFFGGLAVAYWLMIRFLFAPTAAFLEHTGATASLRRSTCLVRGAWWRTFGIFLLGALIAGGIFYAVYIVCVFLGLIVAMPALLMEGGPPVWLIVVLGMTIAAVLAAAQAVMSILMTHTVGLLYIDRRLRTEPGFADALLSAAPAGAPGTTPPPPPPYPPAY